MERCPTCRARYAGERPLCHRCGMDLGRLVALKQAGAQHLSQALRDFDHRDFESMFVNARRAQSLFQTHTGHRLLAVAALATRRFGVAVDLWEGVQAHR